MNDLTPRQQEAYDLIESFIGVHGYSPCIRELCDLLGLASTNGVMVHLKPLKRKGWIDWQEHKPRSIRPLKRQRRGIPILSETALCEAAMDGSLWRDPLP